MSWLKVDDCILSHPKFIRAREGSDLAYETWTALLCWTKRNLTDGVVPGDALAYLEGTRSPQKRAAAIRALVDAGLLDRLPCGGVRLHDYLDWNDSAETVKARRKEDSGRKRRPTARTTQDRPELGDSSALARQERGASSEPARQERDISGDSARNATQANTSTYSEIPNGKKSSETETETETETDPRDTSDSAAPKPDPPPFDASEGNHASEPKAPEPKDGTGAPAKKRAKAKPEADRNVLAVFEHWRSKLHPRALLDVPRAKAVRRQLEAGRTVADLIRAVDGCAGSAWHIENRQTDLELICRDAKHVESFMAKADGRGERGGPARPPKPPLDLTSEDAWLK